MGTLFGEFALGAGRDPRQFSSFEQALMVSIILLHELGHIHYRDEDPASPNNKDAKGAILSSTEKEIRADRFAIGQIRQAWKSGDEIRNRYEPMGLGQSYGTGDSERIQLS
jgi:hypothetical protein